MHAVHDVATLLAAVNVPIGHTEHAALADVVAAVLAYDPAAHSVTVLHVVNPVTSAYVPALHAVHDAAMLPDVVYVPIGHNVHVRCRATGTLLRGNWEPNEDIYLAKLISTGEGERNVDATFRQVSE